MSLLFLTSEDFSSEKRYGDGEMILYHNIRGFSMVLFYSPQCMYCQRLIPMFRRMPDNVNGCQFGMVNVSVNKSLIQKASNTITPIQYVPLIILYVNGRPYMRYDGPHDERELSQFILEISNDIQETGFTQLVKERGIPSYAMGVPLFGEDDVSYLEFKEAYTN